MKQYIERFRRLVRPMVKTLYPVKMQSCDLLLIKKACDTCANMNMLGGVNRPQLIAALDAISQGLPDEVSLVCPCPEFEFKFSEAELEALRKVLFNFQAFQGEVVEKVDFPLVTLPALAAAERARKLARQLHPSFIKEEKKP